MREEGGMDGLMMSVLHGSVWTLHFASPVRDNGYKMHDDSWSSEYRI